MFRAYKYRLYPSELQKELIAKHIGSSRFVYNLALETKTTAYLGSKHNFSPFDLIKQLPELKKECEWLKEVNSQSLQQSIQNMDIAFKKFFKGAGFPKFKSKRDRQSFSIPQNVIVENNLLIIPKFKEGIDIVLHRPIKGTIKSATISVTPTGKYFVSILCDTKKDIPIKAPIEENTTIGIDLGIKDFAITSDGEVFENPKYLRKAQSKLKYAQRKYSKHKGKRTKKKLAKLYEDVVNKRKDFLHKTSTKLIRENQTICLETLAVKNMVKNHNLAQAINDVSWSTFVSMLEYKADWYGKNILRIGRFAPSSKTCSNCGNINKELTLKDREWTCGSCSTVLDRDVNAAINIKNFALKNILSGTDRKNQGKLPTLVGALTLEA
ncbi:MAG TPA: RNA-guided endonuclease TnpB family protein [Bacteroidales bacterium]|nr:RNA-guided endonuclease TnpB family protein [Bacteroidales bacterium]